MLQKLKSAAWYKHFQKLFQYVTFAINPKLASKNNYKLSDVPHAWQAQEVKL